MKPFLNCPLPGKVLLLALLLPLAAAAVYPLSDWRLQRRHPVPPLPRLTFASDSLALARGKHLATGPLNCVHCHGEDFGGKIYLDAGALGLVAGPNLTGGRGGVANGFTDTDWIRTIRHGVRRDGSSLLVMPSETYVHLSGRDLADLISYLKQLPPVDRQLPATRLGFLGRVMLLLGKLPVLVAEKTPHQTPLPLLPPANPVAYGRYLADVSGCRGCHGLHLSGGQVAGPPGTPAAANLTPRGSIGTWTEEDFVRSLRTGKRPDGTSIDDFMPWQLAARMRDDELHALWLYLRSVPPQETGNR